MSAHVYVMGAGSFLIVVGIGILLYELQVQRSHMRKARNANRADPSYHRLVDWRRGRLEFILETTHAGVATIGVGGVLLVAGAILSRV